MSKKIKRFEDFIAWQKARKLTSEIYKVTTQGKFATDYGLKDQIRRAAVSSMSNIAEGFERGRPLKSDRRNSGLVPRWIERRSAKSQRLRSSL